MHDDFIRQQIRSAAERDDRETRRMIARIADTCWPGGAGAVNEAVRRNP